MSLISLLISSHPTLLLRNILFPHPACISGWHPLESSEALCTYDHKWCYCCQGSPYPLQSVISLSKTQCGLMGGLLWYIHHSHNFLSHLDIGFLLHTVVKTDSFLESKYAYIFGWTAGTSTINVTVCPCVTESLSHWVMTDTSPYQ